MPAHLVKPTFCMETTKFFARSCLVQAPVFVHLGSRLFLTLQVLLVIYAMLDFIKKLLQMKHALHVGKTYILGLDAPTSIATCQACPQFSQSNAGTGDIDDCL